MSLAGGDHERHARHHRQTALRHGPFGAIGGRYFDHAAGQPGHAPGLRQFIARIDRSTGVELQHIALIPSHYPGQYVVELTLKQRDRRATSQKQRPSTLHIPLQLKRSYD